MSTKAKEIEHQIGKYKITLQVAEESSDCYIEDGDYSASLECADATGELTDSRGEVKAIDAGTTGIIRKWAEANGY